MKEHEIKKKKKRCRRAICISVKVAEYLGIPIEKLLEDEPAKEVW